MSTTGTTVTPGRPLIVCVDDDAPVLDAVQTDLRDRYADRYRIASASSGAAALAVIDARRRRGDDVALVIADQRMPEMTGTELLAAVKERYPNVRSVLLTAYADTNAAIDAINLVRLDHYVMKPWDPPDERLYPIVDELLDEWEATRPVPEAGLRIVGERYSAASHALRDYLARNQVAFRWIDADESAAARLLAAVSSSSDPAPRLPLLVLDDGRVLSEPTTAEVADALELHRITAVDYHDLVVVGGGPAGLAAAVYGGSEGLSVAVVESDGPGGQAGLSSRIENYLGFPAGIAGSELARRAHTQALRFGTDVYTPHRAVALHRADPYRIVELDDGTELRCRAVVLSTGVQYRRLDVDGIDALTGAGVYYGAASTEAAAMEGERVVVVGGANSAGQAALHLARFARQVVMVIRGDSLAERMSQYLVTRIESSDNISVTTGSRVCEVGGAGHLEHVTIETPNGPLALDAAGLFVFIGASPRTEWLGHAVHRDPHGFVVTGSALQPDRWAGMRDPYLLETSVPGVFAVGDVRSGSVKRVASAVGEGSIAVSFVHAVLRAG